MNRGQIWLVTVALAGAVASLAAAAVLWLVLTRPLAVADGLGWLR